MSLLDAMVGRNFQDCRAMIVERYGAILSRRPADGRVARRLRRDRRARRHRAQAGSASNSSTGSRRDGIPKAVATSTRRDRARRSSPAHGALRALSRARRRRRGRARQARARHLPARGRAPRHDACRRASCSRIRAGRARGARRRHDADHGAGPASRRLPSILATASRSCCRRSQHVHGAISRASPRMR